MLRRNVRRCAPARYRYPMPRPTTPRAPIDQRRAYVLLRVRRRRLMSHLATTITARSP